MQQPAKALAPPSDSLGLAGLALGLSLAVVTGFASVYTAIYSNLTLGTALLVAIGAVWVIRRDGEGAASDRFCSVVIGSAGSSMAAAAVFTAPYLLGHLGAGVAQYATVAALAGAGCLVAFAVIALSWSTE